MTFKKNSSIQYLFLFFCFIFSNHTYCQVDNDSLANKTQLYLETTYKKHKNSAPETAAIYADALHKAAVKENSKKNISKALYKKGYIAYKLGNYKIAFKNIEDSFLIAKVIKNDSLLLKNTNLKGNIYLNKSLYTDAIDSYLEAKTIAEQMGNTKDVVVITRNIALIKKEINDNQGALELLLKNLETLNKEDNRNENRQKLLTYFSLVDTYLRLENLEAASLYNTKGFNGSTSEAYSDLHTLFLSNRAIIKYKSGDYKETISICNLLKDETKTQTNPKLLITSYLYLGKSYYELEDYNSTIQNLETIKTVSNNFEDVSPFNLREIYYYLAKSYIKTGDQSLSTQYFDSLIALDKENDLATKTAERKIYKTFDLTSLKDELNALNTKLTKQKKTASYLYGLAALLITSIVVVFIRKQKKNSVRFEKLLKEIETLERKNSKSSSLKNETLVTDDTIRNILNGLKKFESSKTYLNKDATLSHVAKKINTNTSYLSNVINKHKGKSFKKYLTELRINEALIQLKNNKTLRAYTIKAIAAEFGFKRQETFSRAFKSQTGIYPSVYIKNLDKTYIK